MAPTNTFTSSIQNNYGEQAVNNIKNYLNTNRKLCNVMARKEYLIKCRKEGNFPPHIVQNIKCVFKFFENKSPFTNKIYQTVQLLQRKI
jgi:hypothetical protein